MHFSPPHRPVIIGIGNSLMGDDGAGPAVISLLQEKLANTDIIARVEMICLETPGYSLLSYISLQDFVIIIDAACFGGYPGEVRRFILEDITLPVAIEHSELDLHSSDIFKVCHYARQLKLAPANLLFFGIQLVSIQPGTALSPEMSAGVQQTALLIRKELSIIMSSIQHHDFPVISA